jgi:hypothetical protein
VHVSGPAFPSAPNLSLGHGGRVTVVTVWTSGAVVLVEVVVELDSGTAATDFVTVLVVVVVLVEPHAAIKQATTTANAIVIGLIACLTQTLRVGVLAVAKTDELPTTTVVRSRARSTVCKYHRRTARPT